jgi:hypothetical protein
MILNSRIFWIEKRDHGIQQDRLGNYLYRENKNGKQIYKYRSVYMGLVFLSALHTLFFSENTWISVVIGGFFTNINLIQKKMWMYNGILELIWRMKTCPIYWLLSDSKISYIWVSTWRISCNSMLPSNK